MMVIWLASAWDYHSHDQNTARVMIVLIRDLVAIGSRSPLFFLPTLPSLEWLHCGRVPRSG